MILSGLRDYTKHHIAVRRIEHDLNESLTARRFEHSVQVALLTAKLAKRFGHSYWHGYLAGLSHDFAREFSKAEIINICDIEQLYIEPYEKKKPVLLHGKAAAVILEKKYGIVEPAILEAVAHHTLGKENFCELGKILFCADYIAPGRRYIKDSFRESVLSLPLDAMLAVVLKHMDKRGKDWLEPTKMMYKEIKEKIKIEAATSR